MTTIKTAAALAVLLAAFALVGSMDYEDARITTAEVARAQGAKNETRFFLYGPPHRCKAPRHQSGKWEYSGWIIGQADSVYNRPRGGCHFRKIT